MAAKLQQRDSAAAHERLSATWARLVVFLAGRRLRVLMFMIGVTVAAWQLFFFGWRPLQQETVLPAGLTGVRAQLDTPTLEKIQGARAKRLQHTLNLYLEADRAFAASPVVATNP